MSADNRICILRNCNGRWAVWHGDLSANYSCPPDDADDSSQTQEEALALAHKMADDCVILEGGVQFIDNDEIRLALKNDIRYALEQLDNLDQRGSVYSYGNGKRQEGGGVLEFLRLRDRIHSLRGCISSFANGERWRGGFGESYRWFGKRNPIEYAQSTLDLDMPPE